MPLRSNILLILFFTILHNVFAQLSFDNPQVINSKSGLPTDNVVSILQDDLGFIWMSTTKGLCRWDGISAKVFEHNPADSNTISGNFIPRNAFCWDSAGRQIIMGTENGLSFFDPYKMTSKNFVEPDQQTTFLSTIHVVYIDRQGELWLGTNFGVVKFQKGNNAFEQFLFTGKFPEGYNLEKIKINRVLDIKQDIKNDSVLWLATLSGLSKFNKYSGEFTCFQYQVKNFENDLNTFNKITAHSNRKLYIGTWNADMVIFNTANESFELSFGPVASESRYFSPYPVVPFASKSKNELWVSSLEGIGIFNTSTLKFQILKTFKNTEGSGYAPGISFVSDSEMMWLGSEYGALMFNLSSIFFDNYFMSPVDEQHWFLTTSFYEDTPGKKLYIGYARGQGIHYFDLLTNTFHLIPIPKNGHNDIVVRDILPIANREILFLCNDEIYKISADGKKVVSLHLNYAGTSKFMSMARDKNGQVWVSGANSGLQILNTVTGQLSEVVKVKSFFQNKELLPNIKEIVVDKRNRIWFRNEASFGYYNPENDSLHYFENEKKMILLCFYSDNTDTIWVGTYKNGPGFIDTDSPEKGVQIYTSGIEKSILSLQKDVSGSLIMLTNEGIEVLAPGENHTSLFNENEGLIKFDKWSNRDPTVPGKLFQLSDGRYVIGYRRGIGFFRSENLSKSYDPFWPYLSSVKIFDKEISTGEGLFNLKELELNHKQNFLSFEYSALALKHGNDIVFSHKLTGVDRDWVRSNHREVNYSNLQPGQYQFMVKAESKSDSSLTKQTILNITIRSPWWRTWWAYFLFIIVFTGIILSIYRYNLSRSLARKEALRLKELNNLKSRLYANITHEFRTPLTVIKGMSDDMMENMSEKEQTRYANKLEMIDRNSRKLLHLVKQMLDMSKIESGNMKLDLIQDDIVSYLQYVLESFQSMADAKNIKLVFYHETDQVIMDYDPDKMLAIASNLLSNAIKFTPPGGKVIFHVKREETTGSHQLKIKVQDSGIGIDASHLPHIFERFYQVDTSMKRKSEGTGIGLALAREFAELMHGEITVKSTPGEKTEFCVRLPISNNAPFQKSKPILTQPADDFSNTVELMIDEGNAELPLALIIEDNPDMAKYIMSSVSAKYRIKWSQDGREGIMAAIDAIPDIIISDVMMPEKDGFEVCETLKNDERTSHIPIILLTARVTDQDRIEGLSHGADAYLTKPFNKKELFVRLEQLIKIRRQLQEKFRNVEIDLTAKVEPTGEERFLKKAVEVIEKNLDNPELNALLLCENLNMSESQLYRKLKALSGKSTALFIRGIRLSAAKKMLDASTFNISEIAYQCGFSDPAWFSRAFREAYGKSPSEYRK